MPEPVPEERSEEAVRSRLERLAALGGRAAEVAHELRNALAVMETSLHLIRRGVKGSPDVLAKVEPQLARLGAQIHAGHAIVREVLDEARETLDRTLVDLRALALEVVSGVRAREGVSIEVEAARLRVFVDVRQIRQLLLNLVRNAMEALEGQGGGTIRLVALVEHEVLVLRVEDDGPGIDPSIAPRLFQAFATAKRGGTGLGLALCKRIAESHGGAISAAARAPRGTSMEVRIPVVGGARSPSEGRIRKVPG